MDTKTEAT